MMNRKKWMRRLFPLLFFTLVFFFMFAFRHEDELTHAARESIELATYNEDWVIYGNIPNELRENTEGLVPPLRSKVIHRILRQEVLNVVYLPSPSFYVEAGMDQGEGMWRDKAMDWLHADYGHEFVHIEVLPPDFFQKRLPNETFEEGIWLIEEAEETGKGAVPLYTDEPGEIEKTYVPSARALRSLEPDVVIFDVGLLHEEGITVREFIDETVNALNAFYDSRGRFFTYLLLNEALYEDLTLDEKERTTAEHFYMTESERVKTMIDDDFTRIAEQLDFADYKETRRFDGVHETNEAKHERWAREEIVPLL
ncbi:hypothetical protein LGQ02_19760 [Bacillus shivajii]|uniref:hypothetical protein n=1 Tax=Bacillus shivajii TaxID=1983719 RepID=UPI001CFC1919|nr:hypothetical protein [Bacillus shivajii]UCZ52989.1 hypothetical protein LGQ02_19760 [Bacillus shivajii]